MPFLAGSSFLRGRRAAFAQTVSATLVFSGRTASRLSTTLSATLNLSTLLARTLRTAHSATLSLATQSSSHLAHLLGSTLSLASHTQRRVNHQLTANLDLAAQLGRKVRKTVQATLALTSTHRTHLGHRLSAHLTLASARTSHISHQLAATLGLTAISRTLVQTLLQGTLSLSAAVSGVGHAFLPAIQEALTTVRNLAMAALVRSIQLVAAPRAQVRPAVYSALERTTALAAAWKETLMLATPVRATDAPPYISPDEHNIAFSVDLSAALGSLTVSSATLIHAVARYPDQSDVQATTMSGFVNEVVLTSSTSITVVCGDGTQVEGQTIEIAVALHLATTPIAVWEVFLELPVRKGAQD